VPKPPAAETGQAASFALPFPGRVYVTSKGEEMSVASQSLMDNVTYEDLYRRWEQGNWSAYDIDFSEDRTGWEGLSDIQRRSAMWIYSMFFYGEDRVADTLAPYITAAPSEEQAYFLATQQVDEVRHAVFFHRFFREVIGVGGESIQSTLASTLPQLNWGYRGIFDRLDLMAEELRKDRSLPKYAQAITLYHLIVEGSLAQPGQHFIEDFFASEATMPGFSAGMANVSRDEQRHIGFGVKVLSELLADSEECKAAVVELLREVLPYGPAVFSPPDLDRAYTECYGFSLEDIFAFGLKLIRQRWRTIGFPTEEMPPGVFPFDPKASEEDVAERQVKLMMAGILGPPDGPRPESTPELQRIYFDLISRVADPGAANGAPLVYQWHFTDADPWHLVIDNGSTRAEPGQVPNPTVTIETSWADWVASGKPDANQLKMLLARRIRPRGKLRELARMRKVFPG
jgi:ribonucleotide reductase beta subunit family protein with ferritin-like domain